MVRGMAFLWTCPSCDAFVRTELPPSDSEAELRCPECGREFGERIPQTAAPPAERSEPTP